ncbi:alpha/beta-hydrolase, partial [Violaceomyces palustris]
VLSYVRSKPELYDLKRLTISGFSAGANLALSLSASSVASQGSEGVKSVQAFYPKTDFTRIGDSAPNKSRMRSGIDLSPFLVDLFNRSYVLPNQSRSDVRLSPHFFESQRFPKRINVFCGDCDLLYPDAKEFVERLRKEGKELVLFHTIEGEGHAWDKMARTKESREERDRCYQLSIESILESWE